MRTGHAETHPRAAIPRRVPVDPRQRGQSRRLARAEAPPRRPEGPLPREGARAPPRRAHGPPAAPGPHRDVRADQGPGSVADGKRLRPAADRLDGSVVPRDGGDDLARLADREDPALLRRVRRRRPARTRSARPADHDPRRDAAPHAVGLAYAAQYRGDDAVVMAYFGDGATSEGDFHEALNFAGVWHVPVVFVCQNNQWAISVPLKKQTHSRTIAQKALAYGLPGL